MSDPGGSTSSRVSVDGVQRLVEGDRGSILTGLVVGLEGVRSLLIQRVLKLAPMSMRL